MKNEIFLVTFLLIVFFSIGDNNINYRNIKASDMYWENVSHKMLASEKSNNLNPKVKLRINDYYKNEESIRQVKNEIKKLSQEISALKVEADLTKGTDQKDFLDKLLLISSNARVPNNSEINSSDPDNKKSKNQNIKLYDKVTSIPENSHELTSLTAEP